MISFTVYGLSISITDDTGTIITRYVDSLSELGSTLHYYQNWWDEMKGDTHRFFNELLTQPA